MTHTRQGIVRDLIAIVARHGATTQGATRATTLQQLNMDSLEIAMTIFDIEDKYGITVPFTTYEPGTYTLTLGDVADTILRRVNDRADGRSDFDPLGR